MYLRSNGGVLSLAVLTGVGGDSAGVLYMYCIDDADVTVGVGDTATARKELDTYNCYKELSGAVAGYDISSTHCCCQISLFPSCLAESALLTEPQRNPGPVRAQRTVLS